MAWWFLSLAIFGTVGYGLMAHPEAHENVICCISQVARLKSQIIGVESRDVGRETVFSEERYVDSRSKKPGAPVHSIP
jgi:hypothetical protein